MRRPLAGIVSTVLIAVVLTGCGDSGQAPATKAAGPGMSPTENAHTATRFFTAVASNDPAAVEAAYGLAAPGSPALSYLKLLHDGLGQTATPAAVTVNNGRYRVCSATTPPACHTFAAIVLSDGKVNDFTVDGKKIRLR